MFKFGHAYIEPNKFLTPNRNGRIYPAISYEEFNRVFTDIANRITEEGRHGLANFIVVGERFFDVMTDNTDDINGFKFGR